MASKQIPRILSGKRLVENVRVGWLYSEVHFCFPQYDAALGSRSTELFLYASEPFRALFELF